MRQPMTIIVPPARTGTINGVPFTSSIRESDDADRFAAYLAAAASCEVPVIEGSLDQAPERGFIFVYESWGLDAYPALGSRTVLLNANRGELWNGRREKLATDRLGLAAAVECLDYSGWTMGKDGPGGLHGLESVAKRAGMAIGAFRSPTSDYGVLSCVGHCHSLAELLVHYLTVYEEMGLHERRSAE